MAYSKKMKKVLITGASRGIGFATAKRFLKEGYFVVGTSTSGSVPIKGQNFVSVKLRLDDPKSISSAADEIRQKCKTLDILVNNAGMSLEPDANKMDLGILRKVLEVNLIGLIDFTERILPLMNRGGQIVNISSMMASLSSFDNGICPAYRISKTAVNMYTRTLADRLKDKDITVSSFDPGWVRTDMGGREAPRDPEVPAKEIFELVNSNPESGYFWFEGKKRSW